MARMKCAVWKPLGRQEEPRLVKKNKILIHTMVGTLRGTDSMFRRGGYDGTESHFGTSAVGEIWQWQDTEFQADAQLHGNDDCISIENEDWGINNWRGNGPVPPFTKKQLESIIVLCVEICMKHGIPAVELKDSRDSSKGIGTHRLGIDPYRKHGESYTAFRGKACPGDARLKQVNTIIIPEVAKRCRELRNPVSDTPNITASLEANKKYQDALEKINNPNKDIMLLAEACRRRAVEDFAALKRVEVK